MSLKKRTLHPSLQLTDIPSDVFFNFEAFSSHTETRLHSHSWGQIQLISGGMLEMECDDTRFFIPPHLAIWIPAGVIHRSYNSRPLEYCSININDPSLTGLFSQTPSLIKVTPIITAIIDDFRRQAATSARNEMEQRLVQVLLDQFISQPSEEPFLPTSTHKHLAPILAAVEQAPADSRSLKEWAVLVHTTERTLARHCQRELGMSFTEWRLRCRYLYSMELLRKGQTVKEVAMTLGYHQASPFISMFKKYAGVTPEQYKLRWGEAQLS